MVCSPFVFISTSGFWMTLSQSCTGLLLSTSFLNQQPLILFTSCSKALNMFSWAPEPQITSKVQWYPLYPPWRLRHVRNSPFRLCSVYWAGGERGHAGHGWEDDIPPPCLAISDLSKIYFLHATRVLHCEWRSCKHSPCVCIELHKRHGILSIWIFSSSSAGGGRSCTAFNKHQCHCNLKLDLSVYFRQPQLAFLFLPHNCMFPPVMALMSWISLQYDTSYPSSLGKIEGGFSTFCMLNSVELSRVPVTSRSITTGGNGIWFEKQSVSLTEFSSPPSTYERALSWAHLVPAASLPSKFAYRQVDYIRLYI